MSLPYAITQSYESLLTAFSNACEGANKGSVSTPKSPLACFVRTTKDGPVKFSFKFHCKGWHERSSSSKLISIVIEALEIIEPDGRELSSSTVRLNYLHHDSNELRLAQSVHYDFTPPLSDHAHFHAQISNDLIEFQNGEADDLGIDAPIATPVQTQIRTTRIPTCDMTLSSVLLCLVADHVGGPQFQEFYAKVKELQSSLPQPKIEALKNSLGQGCRDVRSTHWFAHQFP